MPHLTKYGNWSAPIPCGIVADVAPLPKTIGTPAARAFLNACSPMRSRLFLPPVRFRSPASSDTRSSTVISSGSFLSTNSFSDASSRSVRWFGASTPAFRQLS